MQQYVYCSACDFSDTDLTRVDIDVSNSFLA